MIHGGFWRATYSKRVMKAVAADLALRGHAAWNVEYRRVGHQQGGGWPATFEDVAAAVDHLAEIADHRLDLTSVTAVGHSAGGQLALWAAAREHPRVRIRRVVGQAAACDIRRAGAAVRDLLGGTVEELPDRYASVNPIELVPLGVPVLLVHGTADTTVPLRTSRRYLEAARAVGDPVELRELSPGHHIEHLYPTSEAWRVAAEWIAERQA